jgi:hypothetical protein
VKRMALLHIALLWNGLRTVPQGPTGGLLAWKRGRRPPVSSGGVVRRPRPNSVSFVLQPYTLATSFDGEEP